MTNINVLLETKNVTRYRLAKESGVPYSTIRDICTYKTTLPKCSAETVYKIAKALNVTMEELVEPPADSKRDFANFRSNVSHHLKNKGDIDFMIELLESDAIRTYWNEGLTFESLYLLSALDYLSRMHDIPRCSNYRDIRCHKFEKPVFPSGILIKDRMFPDQDIKQRAINECIPEFLEHGIIESFLYESV
ncbi:MAG: helix-turn-helix transcriptional regulator [Lachnospiraceae bacterium]|nr:helix-turn-helix transcriptional regulator [Lachnospiraceae bacterium]